MKVHKDWKPLVKELTQAGYDVVSPSDRRALQNKRSQLRNAGILP